MSNVFQNVFERVSERVHRVNTPFVACTMMFGKTNTVNSRITKIDVAGAHVNFRAENHASFRMLAFPHFTEEAQTFFRRTIPKRRVDAGCVKCAPVFFNLFSRLFIDVCQAVFNHMLGNLVHIVEVVAGEVEIGFFGILPVEAEPVNRAKNRVYVFLVLFNRVSIVETHVAPSGIVFG